MRPWVMDATLISLASMVPEPPKVAVFAEQLVSVAESMSAAIRAPLVALRAARWTPIRPLEKSILAALQDALPLMLSPILWLGLLVGPTYGRTGLL